MAAPGRTTRSPQGAQQIEFASLSRYWELRAKRWRATNERRFGIAAAPNSNPSAQLLLELLPAIMSEPGAELAATTLAEAVRLELGATFLLVAPGAGADRLATALLSGRADLVALPGAQAAAVAAALRGR